MASEAEGMVIRGKEIPNKHGLDNEIRFILEAVQKAYLKATINPF